MKVTIKTLVLGLLAACGGGPSGQAVDAPLVVDSVVVDAKPPPHSYVFFTDCATEACNAQKLYRFDPATNQVTAVAGDYQDVLARSLVVHHNKLYFDGRTAAAGDALWVYDPAAPTVAGQNPAQVVDLVPGVAGRSFDYLLSYNDALYFTSEGAARQLYRYDDTQPVSASNPLQLAMPLDANVDSGTPAGYNGKVYFEGRGADTGFELWVYDPTQPNVVDVNPHLVRDTQPGQSSLGPEQFAVVAGKLYFNGFGNEGHELWVYDSAAAPSGNNPRIVIDLFPGASDAYPAELTVVGNTLYFEAQSATVGREVWKYDPALATSASNPLVLDVAPGVAGSASGHFVASAGARVGFRGDGNNGLGSELWLLDSDQAIATGNPRQFDLAAGPPSSFPGDITGCLQTRFCFTTYNGTATLLNVFDPALPLSANNPIGLASPVGGAGDPSTFVTWTSE